MEKEIALFWENFEKETGEKILQKTMSQCFTSAADRGDWGLLVLTNQSLRFRKTPGENWFASLFKAGTPAVSQTAATDIVIPLSSILNLTTPPRKFLDFLFGSPFSGFIVEYSSGDSKERLRFAADPRDGLFTELKSLVANS